MAATANVWPNDAGFDTDYAEHEPIELTVRGSIPYYAAGVLYRTGPLGYKAKTADGKIWASNHWFDGFSCVHRFQIDFPDPNGIARVQYRSRRTVDDFIENIRKTGKLDGFTFAAQRDPCRTFFKKVMGMFVSSRDSYNVGVTLSVNMPGSDLQRPLVNGHSNRIQTLHVKTDAPFAKKLDFETLEPLGIAKQQSLHPDLKGEFSSAHAEVDPKTGDFFNFNLKLGRRSTYRIFRTSNSTGKTDILASFEGKPAYIHSFFLTENYFVLCVWNSHITWAGLSVLYHKNILEAIAKFDPKSKAAWYVIDRRNGKGVIATYESEPFFCFHTVNAWEEPSTTDPKKIDIITELCLFENTDIIHRFCYDNILSSAPGTGDVAKRLSSCLPMQAQFRLGNVNAASKQDQPIELLFKADKSISLELPTINPDYRTYRHRFSYGCADRMKSSFMDGIVKFDNITKTSIHWETEGHTPGEPIFVADPDGKAEDDGVLLTVVLDGFIERSYLLVLNAKTLEEVGRAEVPGPVSFGFHGLFKGML